MGHGACMYQLLSEPRPTCPWAALSPPPSSIMRSSRQMLTLCEKGQRYLHCYHCLHQHRCMFCLKCWFKQLPWVTMFTVTLIWYRWVVYGFKCQSYVFYSPVLIHKHDILHIPLWHYDLTMIRGGNKLISLTSSETDGYNFLFADSTDLSPCQRRLFMATSMTPKTRTSIAVAPTCVCVQTAWPCRTPQLRWQCSSSSVVACPRWPYRPPSTVTTWSRPRLEGRRTWREPRWVVVHSSGPQPLLPHGPL